MSKVLPGLVLGAALMGAGIFANSQTTNTDPLPPAAFVVGVTGTPAATVQAFTIAAPTEDLTITLTDLQVPAALSSAAVVIVQSGAVVAQAALASPATSATAAVTGAVGDYTLYVFGEPNSADSVGTFTVCVAPKSSPSNCIQNASISGNITASSSAAQTTVSTESVPLQVQTAGTYTVTFADDQFPVALQTAPQLAIFQGIQVVATSITSGTQVNLAVGTYTLLAIAQADQTAQAGLYNVSIVGPGGVTLLSTTYPVGKLTNPPLEVSNPSAQTLTLKVTDFQFPTALGSAFAQVTSGATVLGSTSSSAATPATFTGPAGTLQVWSAATAGSGAGTYEVDLNAPSGNLLTTAGAVNNGTALAYAYVTSPLGAGNYQATATDFQFPAVLPSLQFAVAQSGTILQQSTSAASVSFTAAAGPAVLVVGASPPASSAGIFDVDIQTAGSTSTLEFDKTQPVDPTGLISTQAVNIGVSGDFTVTLTDLQYPAPFQNLDLLVSSGGSVLGKIIGGGSFPITATPGTYQLSFIATPASMQQYGMYAVSIANSPTKVTLTASPTTVTTGTTTTLSWTSTNATSCTGTGSGFAGSQNVGSGSVAVSVSATTTFSLTCTGAGGSATQSVTVTTKAASSSGGGGGGKLDAATLVTLSILILAGSSRRRMPARRLS
jgi:hypothetical protein